MCSIVLTITYIRVIPGSADGLHGKHLLLSAPLTLMEKQWLSPLAHDHADLALDMVVLQSMSMACQAENQ